MSTILAPIAAKIRRMANSLIGIPSRFIFFVCGVVSVLMGNFHSALLFLSPSAGLRWYLMPVSSYLLPVALTAVGGFAVVVALLPSSWVERVCKIELDNQRVSSVPIKMLGGFAVFSYLLTVGLYLASFIWRPSPWLVSSVCPACALMFTLGPSLGVVLLLVAPVDAAVYGSLGVAFGYLLVVLRRGSSSRTAITHTDG